MDDNSIADVCSVCARELLDEFQNDETALNVIFQTLVAPALEIGMEVDLHPTHARMSPKQKKKLSKISRNFSHRVTTMEGVLKESNLAPKSSKRHYSRINELDTASSVMLALQKSETSKSKPSNHRHENRNIFSTNESRSRRRLSNTHEDEEEEEKRRDSIKLVESSHENITKEIGELKEQVKILTNLLMKREGKVDD